MSEDRHDVWQIAMFRKKKIDRLKAELAKANEKFDRGAVFIIQADIKRERAEAELTTANERIERLEGFLRSMITENRDHESDAHKYNTPCIVCEAETLLKGE